MDPDLWYEECTCDGGAITLGGETIICPACDGLCYRPHGHQDAAVMEFEYNTDDLYIA